MRNSPLVLSLMISESIICEDGIAESVLLRFVTQKSYCDLKNSIYYYFGILEHYFLESVRVNSIEILWKHCIEKSKAHNEIFNLHSFGSFQRAQSFSRRDHWLWDERSSRPISIIHDSVILLIRCYLKKRISLHRTWMNNLKCVG